LYRIAKAKTGKSALIVGASGGCGTAFMQLGKVAGLKMYGLASASKHAILREYGVISIDYRTQDFVAVLKEAEPAGIDFVFNGMFKDYVPRSLSVLRSGGLLVQYGAPESKAEVIKFLYQFVLTNLLPNGKKIAGYGTHRLGVDTFAPDWTALFHLLAEGQIKPVIAAKFPILEAAKANALLESGQIVGNIVLVTPELFSELK
jgi:NADPH:quinone reductase-like Zn-dependent oxidoreductase